MTVTYSFKKCVPGSFLVVTVASVTSAVGEPDSTFNSKDFWIQYRACLADSFTHGPSVDYYYTATGNVADCILVPSELHWTACLSALSGLNDGATQFELVIL